MTKARMRFDVATLRDIAGEKVFARGETYHRDGQVVLLSVERERIVGQVAGTEDYRTEILGRGKRIDGECTCPAYEDWGFCKHMVALALAANEAGPDADGTGALAHIRDHLKKKSVDALVEMILEIAERDAALFRKLEIAASALQGDDKTLEARLRRAIDGATKMRGFVDYGEAADWAEGVESALDALAELASSDRAGLVLKLAEHAIERIETASGSIDDSEGHCGALLHRARDIHHAAARKARPDPVALARDLFAREMESDFETFHGAVSVYADVLGKKGLAEYRRLAAEAWAKLPALTGKPRERERSDGDYDRLRDILDVFAVREGDMEARIALRAKDLSSSWRYLQLAQFCRDQGRNAEALRHAEEGLWVFEDGRPDERLVVFVTELLAKAGRKSDAEAHLWRLFEKEPRLDLYARLRKLGGTAARDRAIALLKVHAEKNKSNRWRYPAEALLHIMMREKMLDAAWEVVSSHDAAMDTKVELARLSETTHPHEAAAVYVARVDELVLSGNGYEDAAKLVKRVAALHNAVEQKTYVATLRERFARRRNFVKLLS
jgi:uncharacterized Zn finger protein